MGSYPVLTADYLFDRNSPLQMLLSEETLTSVCHQHAFMVLAYVYEGEGIHYIAQDKIRVEPGDLFVIPPGVTHVFQPLDFTGSRPLRILNVLLKREIFDIPPELSGSLSEADLARLALLRKQTSWSGYRDKAMELTDLFNNLQKTYSNQTSTSLPAMYSLLCKLFSIINPHKQVPFHEEPQTENDPFHDVILFMINHFNQRISLQEISRYISISSRHFQRLFKYKTGKSFIQMLQEIRMKYSCVFLAFTDMRIQNIALEVGIGDMKYFYRLFREYSGMTPASYRHWQQYHYHSILEGMIYSARHSAH